MGEIKIYAARDAMEAHFLRGLLEGEGIPAVIKGESLGAARGELPLTQETLPGVWVRRQDTARALEIIQALQHRPAEKPEPWTCPRCGELIEGQFSECWRCGAERPES